MNKGFFTRFSRGAAGGPTDPKTSQGQTENERRLVDLCAVPVQEALNTLNTTLRGLTSEEAERHLHEVGPNELSHGKRLGFWADIFRRCRSPLVVQLLIIALVSSSE
jgi:Mg2+-importing ATPase